ncbi:MAG: hypothetical protein WC694_03695, partial [Candidatus Paceibacterota bacterium]
MLLQNKKEEVKAESANRGPVREKSVVYEEEKVNPLMSSIIKRSSTPPEVDSIVEGPVVNIDKSSLYIDIAPFGTGIIFGREFINARDVIKKINI